MAKQDTTRVTVNIKSELVEQIDKYAEELGITRTSACSVLLYQAINGQKAMNDLGELVKLCRDKNEVQG